MREIIQTYQNTVAGEVSRFEGHVAKYMGDGVLAYFGWPRAQEDAAERAVRVGLAVTAAVGGLEAPDGEPLAARVGVATGAVVIGELVGSEEARERAVVGEAPNLAARLQALAQPGTVVVAEGTRHLVGDLFAMRDLGLTDLKGYAEPIRAWQVVGEGTAEGRFEALHPATALTPLIGREHELALLLDRWARAKGGEGQVVLLTGEPGIGKSRLVRALRERLADEPHIWLGQFCSPYHVNTALHPVVGLLKRAAGLRREDPPPQQLAKLEAMLGRAVKDVREVAPIVADLLGIPAEGRYPPPDLSPQQKKQRTFQVLLDQLAGLAARQPVLALFEDVHWADPTTIELIGRVIERALRLPVLALVTFRPEFIPLWAGHGHVTALPLGRLGRKQGEAMVEGVAGGKALPAEVLDDIVAKTDGVPLFVEELTKTVLESGLLAEREGSYELTMPLPSLAVLATLHDSLMARLDRLAPVKEVAQLAACLGRDFDHALLAAVSPLSEPELTAALDRLVTAELVFRRGTPPEASYSFKHALVRDAAYESLLKSRRRQLHARIVAVLEECFPKRVENEPALLAVHCAEAGLAEKAVGYWYEAGQRALAQSAMMEAVAQLRRALELLAGLPLGPGRDRRELDLQLALGGALIAEIGWGVEETRRAYARARDLCRELDEIERLFPVLWGLTVYHINHAEMLPAVETAEEMLRLAECRDEVTLRLASHRAAATAYYHAGELTKARAHAEATLALYDRDRDRTLVYIYAADFRVLALSVLSLALLGLGYPDQASAARREAVAHARELAHPHSVGMALAFSGIFAFFARDFSDLLAHAEALMALAAEHGLQHYASKAALYRDCVQALAGGENAFERCRLGLAVHRVAGQEREVPICLTLMAEARRRAGRPEEALGLLDEPLDRLKRTREGWIEAELHRIRGELLLAQPKPDSNEAEACLRSALETARRQSAQMWELRAAQSLARLWIGQGKQRAARNLLAPVYGRFTEGFGTPDLQDAAALLRALGQGPC